MKLKELLSNINEKLVVEDKRIKIQFIIVYILFAIISTVMTVVNIITGYKALMWMTVAFAGANIINILLTMINDKVEKVIRVIFSIEVFVLFAFFVFIGEPEGFSANWIAILPLGGMLLYRRKYGTIMSTIGFILLVLFFWTPVGRDLIHYFQGETIVYSESYMLRFPFLYLACFGIGFTFETIRALIQSKLNKSTERYRKLSYMDTLTGVGNDNAYVHETERIDKAITKGKARFAVFSFDMNNLKATDDTYGHRYGAYLIVCAAKRLKTVFSGSVICHVGGDEFVVIIENDRVDKIDQYIQVTHQMLDYDTVEIDGLKLILSAAFGVAIYEDGEVFKDTFQRADKEMYKHKKELKKQYNISER